MLDPMIFSILSNDTVLKVLSALVKLKRTSFYHLKEEFPDTSDKQLSEALDVLQSHDLVRAKSRSTPGLSTFVVTSGGLETGYQLKREFKVEIG